MSTRILHNPRCSKSRATLELLREHGVDPEVVLYLEQPPTASELEQWLQALAWEPRQLMRRKEAEYAELGLDEPALSRAALIQAMVEHPRLIERPIVIRDGRVRLGRPPEAVLELLADA